MRDYVKRMVEDTVARFGKLDVLVNNAAMAIFGPFEKTTTQDWRKVMGTDLGQCVLSHPAKRCLTF